MLNIKRRVIKNGSNTLPSLRKIIGFGGGGVCVALRPCFADEDSVMCPDSEQVITPPQLHRRLCRQSLRLRRTSVNIQTLPLGVLCKNRTSYMIQQNVKLIEPTAELESDFLAMANDHRICGDERYRAALEDFSAYLESLAIAALNKNLPPNLVPEDEFWLVSDSCVIGRSKLRHWLIPASEHEGGHIGYDIRPSKRRKGYGTLILKLTLEKAKDLGLTRVLLTCDADNIASSRIIEKHGGALSGRATSKKNGKPILQYWIELC